MAKAKTKTNTKTKTKTTRGRTSSDALADDLNKLQLKNYLDALEPGPRRILKELRGLILAAATGATDSFSYGIPATRWKGKLLVHYAAWKKHASMYPIAPGVSTEELKGWRTSKGTIQFPYTKPLPEALIRKLVKARVRDMAGE